MAGTDPVTDLVGKSLDLAKPVVETGCRLVESLLGKPCEVVRGMLADQLYVWQWRNRIRIANRAKQIMDAKGIAEKVLPPGFLVPLLDKAGYADDPTLQEMWANLLASAVDNEACRRSAYVAVLSQLSRDEALLLAGRAAGFKVVMRVADSAQRDRIAEMFVRTYKGVKERWVPYDDLCRSGAHLRALCLAIYGQERVRYRVNSLAANGGRGEFGFEPVEVESGSVISGHYVQVYTSEPLPFGEYLLAACGVRPLKQEQPE